MGKQRNRFSSDDKNNSLVFSALSPSGDNGIGIAIRRGIGSLTHPANDSADGQRLVRDHEGIYRAVKQNEARFDGARRVENLLTYSEDFSQSYWTKAASATVTGTNTINLAAD